MKKNIKIAGAFLYKNEIIKYIFKNNLLKKYNIIVYDGVNNCKWNGGRINYKNDIILKDIEFYNKLNISVNFTFTNWIIDFNDQVGLQLLDWLNFSQEKYNIKNSITLSNEKFRKFLRKKYNFKLISSFIRRPSWLTSNVSYKKALKYYKNEEFKYDLIVPNHLLIMKEWFLSNLNLNKYEIMFFYECHYDCPYVKRHFRDISKQNCLSNETKNMNIDNCFLNNPEYNYPKINHNYSKLYFKKLLKYFNNFKFAGRDVKFKELESDLNILI